MKWLAAPNWNCGPLRLFDAVPPPPKPHSARGSRKDFVGLLVKYNWQFRRPFPQNCNAAQLDTWEKVPTHTLQADGHLEYLSSQFFEVPINEFKETCVWHQNDVNWNAIRTRCSSLSVPAKASSAVGGGSFHYIREVLAISFPALCWILRNSHTAEEIETAWQLMPIVRPGKSNRGVSSTSCY